MSMVLVRCILYEDDGDDAVGLFSCSGRLKRGGWDVSGST
jgi:hypothetical protein